MAFPVSIDYVFKQNENFQMKFRTMNAKLFIHKSMAGCVASWIKWWVRKRYYDLESTQSINLTARLGRMSSGNVTFTLPTNAFREIIEKENWFSNDEPQTSWILNVVVANNILFPGGAVSLLFNSNFCTLLSKKTGQICIRRSFPFILLCKNFPHCREYP